ncbi:hypothetical protein [Pseudorhodobacter sp.]|uniref:hypothetical protein n=1 Tax=Pseudorhodobacter sp. TaxID=1934400 RepID=UPI0026488AC1|nr:hypothetical protein [Pseudorhodobacter sp.]MDN5788913.1 hypothetical protein [Pseudorhodobacter sp.]
MFSQTLRQPHRPRLIHQLPILGTVWRDIAREPDSIYYALVILLTALVLAVKTWGIVALALSALALVPVVFTCLLLITRG